MTREKSERAANVEYPWQSDPTDPASWVAPAAHDFPVIRALQKDPRSIAAVRLLEQLIVAAESVLTDP